MTPEPAAPPPAPAPPKAPRWVWAAILTALVIGYVAGLMRVVYLLELARAGVPL